MTRNKLAGQVKSHEAARRDFRRVTAARGDRDGEEDPGAERIAGQDPTPSRDLAARELLEEALGASPPRRGESWTVASRAASGPRSPLSWARAPRRSASGWPGPSIASRTN